MPAPVDKAVPWLLLDTKSHEGSSAFTQAQAIVGMAAREPNQAQLEICDA